MAPAHGQDAASVADDGRDHGGTLSASAQFVKDYAALSSRPRRSIEERHGFAGAIRAVGGIGGHIEEPRPHDRPLAERAC